MFSHFVSGCHLDRIGKLRGDDIQYDGLLPQILDTFIIRMTPDVWTTRSYNSSQHTFLNPRTSLSFVQCTFVECYLLPRRLVQVQPDHPAGLSACGSLMLRHWMSTLV